MSYTPNTWKSGDVVTSAKLNKIEQGIANAGGIGVMYVEFTDPDDTGEFTANKTWQEICDAIVGGNLVVWSAYGEDYAFMHVFNRANRILDVYSIYEVGGANNAFASCDSSSGYPSFED